MLPCWLNLRSFKVHAAMPKAGKKENNKSVAARRTQRTSVAKSLSKVGWVWVAVVVVDAVDVDVFGSFAAPQVHRPFTSLPDMPEVANQTKPIFPRLPQTCQN